MSLIWPRQKLCLCCVMPPATFQIVFNEENTKLRRILIFSYTPFCILLPLVRDSGLFRISEQGREVELFWLQGRVFFTLIYQTRRLASYYLDYSLTSAEYLCETDLFMTRFPSDVRDTQKRIALICK